MTATALSVGNSYDVLVVGGGPSGSTVATVRRRDFSFSAFRPYAARLHRGIAPFLAMIQRFYEPAFLDLFFGPTPQAPVSRCAVGAQWGGL